VKIVEVIWDDAWADMDEVSIEEAAKLKLYRTHSVGVLVAENDEGLVIAMDYYPKNKKIAKTHAVIPWGMIVEWYELNE